MNIIGTTRTVDMDIDVKFGVTIVTATTSRGKKLDRVVVTGDTHESIIAEELSVLPPNATAQEVRRAFDRIDRRCN